VNMLIQMNQCPYKRTGMCSTHNFDHLEFSKTEPTSATILCTSMLLLS